MRESICKTPQSTVPISLVGSIPFGLYAKTKHGGVDATSAPDIADKNAADRNPFSGIWRSQGGSLYVFYGANFVCVAVHSSRYRGWLNQVAVKNVHRSGERWAAWQAFRNRNTGRLLSWECIDVTVQKDLVTKYFPSHLPPELLIYGHVEHYYRIRMN